MLTSFFVCQPNYNATRHRLKLRVIGTLVGIAIGIPVLCVCAVTGRAAGSLVIPACSFLPSVTCNTLMQRCHHTLVLLCFNLLGEGFEVALPRVMDTLIGCAIAWAAVSYIWPDWQFRDLPRMLERATRPTAVSRCHTESNTIRGVITVWRIVLPAAMHTTVMLSWRRWYQICPASRTLPANSRGRVSVAVP
ncbi:FUSC family protein [Escherichia coli]